VPPWLCRAIDFCQHAAGGNGKWERHLDELGACAEESPGVIDMLDDLHGAHDVESAAFCAEQCLSRGVLVLETSTRRGWSEVRVERGVVRRDGDVCRGRVDAEGVCPETRKTL